MDMEKNIATSKPETILKIELLGESEMVPTVSNDKESDWLENNNAEIIGITSPDDQEQGLDKVISSIVKKTDDGRAIQCEDLQICSDDRGYKLLTEQGEILLKNGDIISLPGVNLKVSLISGHVVAAVNDTEHSNDQAVAPPKKDEDDIWSNAADTDRHNNTAVNPFVSQPDDPFSHRNKNLEQNDSLGFLHDDRHSSAHNEEVYIGVNDGHALAPFPGADESFGLLENRNESQAYAETNNQSAGNVLLELGINEEQSTIADKQYTTTEGKASFLDQSPADMLDEYLDVNNDAGLVDYRCNDVSHGPEQEASGFGVGDLAKRVKRAAKAFTT